VRERSKQPAPALSCRCRVRKQPRIHTPRAIDAAWASYFRSQHQSGILLWQTSNTEHVITFEISGLIGNGHVTQKDASE
jgi:hypothetical protein